MAVLRCSVSWLDPLLIQSSSGRSGAVQALLVDQFLSASRAHVFNPYVQLQFVLRNMRIIVSTNVCMYEHNSRDVQLNVLSITSTINNSLDN